MTDTRDLKALSEAATQGVWEARLNTLGADLYSHPHGYVGAFTSNALPMPHTLTRMQADAAYIAALANGHRDGTLIPATEVEGWQPIETADPADLGKALLLDDGEPVVGEYLAGPSQWYDQEMRWLDSVTHWMPLPQPPVEDAEPAPRIYTATEVEERVKAEREACAVLADYSGAIQHPADGSYSGHEPVMGPDVGEAIRARGGPQ